MYHRITNANSNRQTLWSNARHRYCGPHATRDPNTCWSIRQTAATPLRLSSSIHDTGPSGACRPSPSCSPATPAR
eukprot:1359779-Pleurochrysis_carterae.AAC.1